MHEKAYGNDGGLFEMGLDMSNRGFCSLIVEGDNLDLDLIEKTLKMEASKKRKKGEIVNDIIGEMKNDSIRFDEKTMGEYNPDKTMFALINKLMDNKTFIKDLSNRAHIYLVCYVQSDYAMIDYTLSAKTLNVINELGVDLEISIFSWGGVKDDRKKKKKRNEKKEKKQK